MQNVECFKCRKKGHISKDCPDYKSVNNFEMNLNKQWTKDLLKLME